MSVVARRPAHRRAVEALLSAGLQAHRQGGLRALDPRHARLSRLMERPWLSVVAGSLGDALPAQEQLRLAPQLLLAWGLSQLRPDRRPGLDGIDAHAWLQSTSWRPLFALACHHGFLTVPAFPERYRRRADESPVDNLCGLWAVGPSTFYRYLDKARRQLTDLFSGPLPPGDRLLSLRMTVDLHLTQLPTPQEGWAAWRQQQAPQALLKADVAACLWHQWQAGDLGGMLTTLHRLAIEAAGSTETDALLALMERSPALTPTQRFELALRQSMLWRYRNELERENEALQHALRLADEGKAPLMLGRAHAELARFQEGRDPDRAFACYDQAIEHLHQAVSLEAPPAHAGSPAGPAVEAYASALVRLAWMHLRRNNPMARSLLDRVQQLAAQHALSAEVIGPLEQTWGEYWRCLGELQRAVEHKHKALLVHERSGDQRAVLNTYRNLSLIYGEAGDTERALDYGLRVVRAAESLSVEPEVLAGAHGNLGVTYFYQARYDLAILQYEKALEIFARSGLRNHLAAAHFNLAEAHYKRFQLAGSPADETLGDHHAAAAARISAENNTPGLHESARSLKREILGQGNGPDRLMPEEFAVHFAEMAQIQRLRHGLALPQPPAAQVRTHLAIARAYQTIATQEREAALALAARHQLQEDFSTELGELRHTFERELSREQRLNDHWRQAAGDLLTDARRQTVLGQLHAAQSINKSRYADLTGVSPATASKQLMLLADRGLLLQLGKGPSTRYVLPDALPPGTG